MLNQRKAGHLACYTLHPAKVNAPTETDTTVVTGDQMNLYSGAKVE